MWTPFGEKKQVPVVDMSYGADDTYTMTAHCTNCGSDCHVKYAKGRRTAVTADCPACGCMNLQHGKLVG